VCDPATVETLSLREWSSGFAEVVKTGLLAGGRLWELVRGWEPGRGSPDDRLELIRRCAAYKAGSSSPTPRERGQRAVLNLGIRRPRDRGGHRLQGVLARRAVAIGLLAALWLSSQSTGLTRPSRMRGDATCPQAGAACGRPEMSTPARSSMRWPTTRRLRRGARVHFALLEWVSAGRVWGTDPGD
jgi:3-dehydroquinate synthetase